MHRICRVVGGDSKRRNARPTFRILQRRWFSVFGFQLPKDERYECDPHGPRRRQSAASPRTASARRAMLSRRISRSGKELQGLCTMHGEKIVALRRTYPMDS
jgi:hypothetical protein